MSSVAWILSASGVLALGVVGFLAYVQVTWARRRHGERLLTVSKLECHAAHSFEVPLGIDEVDFFLDVRAGGGRWLGSDVLALRVTGPVPRDFALKVGSDDGQSTFRRTLKRVQPGPYRIELVGSTRAVFGELVVAGHRAPE